MDIVNTIFINRAPPGPTVPARRGWLPENAAARRLAARIRPNTHTHARAHTHTHTHTHTCTHTHAHAHMHAHTHTQRVTCLPAYLPTYRDHEHTNAPRSRDPGHVVTPRPRDHGPAIKPSWPWLCSANNVSGAS